MTRVGSELRRFTSAAHAGARYVAQRLILKPVVWSVTRVRVLGRERLRALGPSFIVVANHSSHLDAPLITGALPAGKARYLAAGAAADYFFEIRWRRFLTALFFNAFPVDRNGVRSQPGLAKRLLGAGVPLLIFPEGSRSKNGEMGQFKAGAAALSIASGVPCLPVAIIGASAAMPRGRSWPVPGRPAVAVVFGAPMSAGPGENAESFTRRLAEEIQQLQDSFSLTAPPGAEPARKGLT